MLKFAVAASVLVFLALAPAPARADCPDGYCPDGTRLDSVRQREQRAAQAHANARARCINACTSVVCGNLHGDVCIHEKWGSLRSCQAKCK